MTVQELIDKLATVKNKNQKVVINGSGESFPITNIDIVEGKVWIESNEL